jgi:serine/threonine protein kinase
MDIYSHPTSSPPPPLLQNSTTTTIPNAPTVAYITHKLYVLQLFLLCGYGVMFLLCLALLVHLRRNRQGALRGDTTAARKVILPAFEPLLWILGGATGTYTLFLASAIGAKLYTSDISRVSSELFYSGRQFVFVCVLVFLYQKSVSIPALRRTLFVSFLLASYTVPIVWYLTHYVQPADFYFALMAVRAPLLLLYAYVFLRPPGRASRRTLREYCLFTFVYYALLFAFIELMRRRQFDLGFSMAYANLAWGALCPLVIWRVLKADTEHWRGLGQRAVALQSHFRQRRAALDERVSSQGLHVLIEMHRKLVIDFAYLEIQEQIGVGSSALVFNGLLHSKTHVAIKVYSPHEFSEETVAAFSHEAALCGALRHPNIVTFYGMCVCPPTICLVSELCVASLDDVLKAIHARRASNPDRQQFLLNLGYMLDAARAVAYLHSFSPPFVHRDIMPRNFLVDYKSTVKLTDFGESRSLPRPHNSAAPRGRDLHPYMVLASRAHVNREGRYAGNAASLNASLVRQGSMPVMSVRGTVDYMAPEVIQGRAGLASYAEAADVYSLAITMWDILNPGQPKFPTLRSNNHLQIFESVIEGKRPALDSHLHPSLREIIQNAWHSDVRLRPSAQTVVQILESIQEEVMAVFAAQLLSEIDTESRRTPTDCSFTGAEAVAHMVDCGYALGEGEAVRLGNALMDAGHLHHERHSKGFANSTVELYYLDEDNIRICRPLHPPTAVARREQQSPWENEESEEEKEEEKGSGSGEASATTLPEPRSHRMLAEQHGLCACRELGQRLHGGHGHRRLGTRITKKKRRDDEKRKKIGTIFEETSASRLSRSLLADEDDDDDGDGDGAGETVDDSGGHIAITINGPAAA